MIGKKIKIGISSILAVTTILMGTSIIASAETNINTNLRENEDSQYWAKHFESFNNDLESGKLVKLKDASTVYLKYTVDENNEEVVEEFTEKEYEQERLKEKITRYGIGSFEPNGNCSWLKLDLQVYENSAGKYNVYSFWEWKTRPKCRFTDINGIYVSSEFVISNGPIQTQYIAQDDNGNEVFEHPSYKISEFGNGVACYFIFKGDSELFTYVYNMGMTSAQVEFANSASRSGRIFTNYVHGQIALGDISFDSQGKPSFGLNVSTDQHSGSVYISR